MSVPPRAVRRVLLAPAMLFVTLVAIATVPLWALLAAALSPIFPGRLRPLRFLWLVVVYLLVECVGIVVSFGLWLLSGFGALLRTEAFREHHYRLLRWALVFGIKNAVWALKITIDIDKVDENDLRPQDSHRPLLVFCRHAGPGDSLLLLHEVMVRLGRRPRIVLKDVLQYDPFLDIVLNRLPNSFVTSGPDASNRVESSIQELAEDMDGRDALVLFPEGGNFTKGRRTRAIAKLRSLGYADEADSAETMTRVLPPKPGGALAAIAANPDTDILFIAHTGLEHMSTPRDLWRGLPMDRPIRAGWWLEPEEVVPQGRDAQVDWLFARWRDVDTWIGRNDDTGSTPAQTA